MFFFDSLQTQFYKLAFVTLLDSRASRRQVDFQWENPLRDLQNTAKNRLRDYRKNSCLSVASSAFYEEERVIMTLAILYGAAVLHHFCCQKW